MQGQYHAFIQSLEYRLEEVWETVKPCVQIKYIKWCFKSHFPFPHHDNMVQQMLHANINLDSCSYLIFLSLVLSCIWSSVDGIDWFSSLWGLNYWSGLVWPHFAVNIIKKLTVITLIIIGVIYLTELTCLVKMTLTCIRVKSHCRIKGFALDLILKQRLGPIWKWRIAAILGFGNFDSEKGKFLMV